MARIVLRCNGCGERAEADIGESELPGLRSGGSLTRFCNRCRGQVRWSEEQSSTGGFRAALATPAGARRPSVLLIDDDPSILTILNKALGPENLALDCADSARKAVQMLSRDDYDLILSDIRMPEFDGKQMFAFLAEHQPHYRGRVVFLTGDTGNPETMRFLEKTQCAYLTKPMDIPALISLLRQRLSRG